MLLKSVVRRSAGVIPFALLAVLFSYWSTDNGCDDNTATRGDLMKAVAVVIDSLSRTARRKRSYS